MVADISIRYLIDGQTNIKVTLIGFVTLGYISYEVWNPNNNSSIAQKNMIIHPDSNYTI